MSPVKPSDLLFSGRAPWMAYLFDVLLILAFCVAFLGYRLGSCWPLTDHEALVAVTAQEALHDGQWLVPHFNGQIRLQKTPGMYWVVAACGCLFGQINEFVVRLPSMISAAAVAVMMYWLGRRMFDRVMGIIAGLATAGSAGILWQSHVGTADMLMTAFVTATMLLLWPALEAVQSGQRGTRHFLLAYLAFALGMMAKGPVPLPAVGLPIAGYLFWLSFYGARDAIVPAANVGRREIPSRWTWPALERFTQYVLRLQLHWGFILLILIVGGWVFAIWWTVPNAFDRWQAEYVARFFGQFGTKRPWYYYGPLIFLLTLPWSVFLPIGLVLPFRKDTADRRRELMYLFLWLIVGLVFFSAAEGKRPHYILPIVPPAILLSVAGFTFALQRWGTARHVITAVSLAVLVTAAGALGASFYVRSSFPQVMTGFYALIGIVLVMEVLSAFAFLRFGGLPAATVLAVASGVCFAIVWPMYPLVSDPNRDPERVSRLISKTIGPNAQIFFLGRAHGQLIYYYGRNMPQIPTDQEITKVYLKASDKFTAMLEIQNLVMEHVLALLQDKKCKYFVTSDEKVDLARENAEAHGFKLYEWLRAPDFFSDTKSMVILGNCPPPATAPTTRGAVRAGLNRGQRSR